MRHIKTSKTTRLFWKRFPYKAVIWAEWAGCIRSLAHEDLDKIDPEKTYHPYRLFSKHETKVRKMFDLLAQYDQKEIKIRSEHNSLSIYFTDYGFFDILRADFEKEIQEFVEPEDETVLNYLLNNRKIEVKPSLLYDCRYKVLVAYDKKSTVESRKNFINLAKAHPDKIHITDRTAHLIEKERMWYSQPYFYVKDSKYLMLTQMMLQHNIKSIIEIVTPDEIKEKETVNAE
jgi:hypothetical protein